MHTFKGVVLSCGDGAFINVAWTLDKEQVKDPAYRSSFIDEREKDLLQYLGHIPGVEGLTSKDGKEGTLLMTYRWSKLDWERARNTFLCLLEATCTGRTKVSVIEKEPPEKLLEARIEFRLTPPELAN